MISEKNKRQFELWDEFKHEISYSNRFIVKNDEFIHALDRIIEKNRIIVNEDTVCYRARIYNDYVGFINDYKNKTNIAEQETTSIAENDSINSIVKALVEAQKELKRDWEARSSSGYWGYDSKDSFIPLDADKVKDGRANPTKIIYLYMSNDPNAALAEVRPILDEYVSVAEIRVLKSLEVVDLSFDKLNYDEDITLQYLISEEFSRPNNNDLFQYIPTQFISEYVKSKNYDGIKYPSSLYKSGRNYVVFNHDKCVPISSKLYRINDICYDAKGEAPFARLPGDPSYDLCSWRLRDVKKDEFEKRIKSIFGDKIESSDELKRLLDIE